MAQSSKTLVQRRRPVRLTPREAWCRRAPRSLVAVGYFPLRTADPCATIYRTHPRNPRCRRGKGLMRAQGQAFR
jgi:hypothetical protein